MNIYADPAVIGMFNRSAVLSTSTVFGDGSAGNTFFSNLNDLSADTASSTARVEDNVDGRLKLLARRTDGVTSNLRRGLLRLNTTDSYLAGVQGVLGAIEKHTDLAADTTTTEAERAVLGADIDALFDQLDAYYFGATFERQSILTGGESMVQISPDGEIYTISDGNTNISYLGLEDYAIDTAANAASAQETIAQALENVSSQRATLTAQHDILSGHMEALAAERGTVTEAQNRSAEESGITVAIQEVIAFIRSSMTNSIRIQESELRVSRITGLLESAIKPAAPVGETTDESSETSVNSMIAPDETD